MKNFFSFNKNRSLLLVTVFLVTLLGAGYFFIHIPKNAKYVEDRHFRCLQNVETNIHAKIDNSIGLLNNLLETRISNRANFSRDSIDNYIKRYSRENFVLLPIDTATLTKDAKQSGINADSICKITFKNRELLIELYKKNFKIGLVYKIEKFLTPLLPEDKFNEYLLLSDEAIVYQTFPSGIAGITKDSLPSKKSAFLRKGNIKNIELSGTSYKFFPQQVNLAADQASLTLVGLLAKDKYEYLKKKLPENISLLLLTLAIALILSLPWIKLYQMGNRDRLTVTDGLFSFAVSMLLMSTLFFMFLKYNAYLRPGKNGSEISRENLAGSIQKAFDKEVASAYRTLTRLDSFRSAKNYKDKSVGGNSNFKDPLNRSIDSAVKAASGNLGVNYTFWLNNRGEELTAWSLQRDISPPGNFAGRAYFKRIQSPNTAYSFGADSAFYLEQVASLTRGTFTTVISKASITKGQVAALSFNLKSVDNAILPCGYLFAVVDKEGKVLYHANRFKNLNENISEEFTEGKTLKNILASGGDEFFTTEYLGKEFKVFAKHFSNYPYHIVVLEDTSYKYLRDTKTFGFSFLMLFSFFLVLILELLVVFLVSRRPSFLKKQYSDISWVGPHECFRQEYKTAVLLNIAVIILLCIFRFFNLGFLQYLFVLLVSCTAITIALNNLYLNTYKKISPEKYRLKLSSQKALLALTVVINLIALAVLQYQFIAFLLLEVLILAVTFFTLRFSGRIFKVLKKYSSTSNLNFDYCSSYSLMLFTRLIVTSGIPVVLFYTSVFDYELKLTARYKHAQFVSELLAKGKITGSGELIREGVYNDSIWVKTYATAGTDSEFIRPDSRESYFTGELFKYFTAFNTFNNEEPEQTSSSGQLVYNSIIDSARAQTFYPAFSGKHLKLSSAILKYGLPKFDLKGLLFWLLLLAILFFFWKALDSIIRKLFAVNLPKATGWEDIDEVLLTDPELNDLIFMIGSPGSGKTTRLKNYINNGILKGKNSVDLIYNEDKPEYNNVFILDIILIPSDLSEAGTDPAWLAAKSEVFSGKYELIIVNHFEYDIKNDATNRIKLEFLETLLQKNKGNIIVVSTVHPINFLDSLNDQEFYNSGEQRLPKHDLERWHVLLGHFKIVIAKITSGEIKIPANVEGWQKGLFLETASTQFSNKIYRPIKNKLEGIKPEPEADSLAFKLQITSHYFYMYIWQSLTKEEKFLLWDLAEDGLVNSFDDYNLSLLVCKGIIVKNESGLSLFNKGFRNFILTAIGKAEVMLIQKQIEDNGNWRKLKQPFFILIVAVLAFLYASQQETYKTLLTYLGILTAALPVVLKFFTLFESNSQKNS